jgi:hypothetical protein
MTRNVFEGYTKWGLQINCRKRSRISGITVLEHPPSSLDLAPSYFCLFLKINEILKGKHFDYIDDIRSNTTAALKVIPQNQFQNCFERWTRHLHRCIASQGE